MANIFLDKVSIGGNTYDIHDIAVRELLASEEKSSTAVAAHAAGRYLVYDDHLYTAKTDIAVGDTLVVDTNIELVPGGAINQIADLKSAIDMIKVDVEADKTAAEAASQAVQDMGAAATTLAAGSSATVTKSVEQSGVVTLTFGIPKGDTGATGAQGPQGIQGEQGPQGIQGERGPAGADGAVSITVSGTTLIVT